MNADNAVMRSCLIFCLYQPVSSELLYVQGLIHPSLFPLSSYSLQAAGKQEFSTSIPCIWLLPVAVDDKRSIKSKVSQFSTSCRLANLGAMAE